MDSVATFSRLQQQGGATPNWRQVGSLRIALSDARVEEFGRLCATACSAGLEVELLDHAGAKARWPGLVADRAKAILWCPATVICSPTISPWHTASTRAPPACASRPTCG